MLYWVRRLFCGTRDKARSAVVAAQACDDCDRDRVFKQDMTTRLHDQRARLHGLEWQTDVEGRRTKGTAQ